MNRKLSVFTFFLVILAVAFLAACATPAGGGKQPVIQASPVLLSASDENPACEVCDQATVAALTQQKNEDAWAAATAQVAYAKAQAILNEANATLGAAQTQDAIRQTQTAALATNAAQIALNQYNQDQLAAGTQTAIANLIATQTQSAAATSQWYADQDRQLQEQRQGPITFMLMLCVPVFLVVLAILIIWALWRWVKIEQGPRILDDPVEKLPAPTDGVTHHRPVVPALYLESSNGVDHHPHLTKPDNQVDRWLDEVKDELRSSDEKDKNDSTDS